MAIEIRETFQVKAPIDTVWQFVMDPHKVVTCMPGAALEQVVDERTFVGSVKIKVGAITANYKGRVQLTQVDPAARVVEMLAEGREPGGGTAKGTVSSRLRPLPDTGTEVVAEASVDLSGRIMQVGRGMIQGVSQQLFLQFVTALKEQLERQPAAAFAAAAPVGAPSPQPAAKPIRVLPLLARALWASIVRFLGTLFGRRPGHD